MDAKQQNPIITLQFGHYSNFIGSHFWNTQDATLDSLGGDSELNHHVLFREGKTIRGENTFTPRLLAFDLKGAFGALRKGGYQYDDNQTVKPEVKPKTRTWKYDVEVIQIDEKKRRTKFFDILYPESQKLPSTQTTTKTSSSAVGTASTMPLESSPSSVAPPSQSLDVLEIYKDLESNVTVWSDYLKAYLHPKTICEVPHIKHEIDPFDVYSIGHEILKHENFAEESLNRFRFFMEECDQLQGFHIFVDQDNAWGAFANDFIQLIKEDYGSKYGVTTFGSSPYFDPLSPKQRNLTNTRLNLALSLTQLLERSNLYIPLSATRLAQSYPSSYLPHFKPEMSYHTSALLASAIDTATLPYRRKKVAYDMKCMHQTMVTLPSLRLASLSLSMPVPVKKTQSLFDLLSTQATVEKSSLFYALSPFHKITDTIGTPYSHICTARGIGGLPLYPIIEQPSTEEQLMAIMSGKLDKLQPKQSQKQSGILSDCSSHQEMFSKYVNQTACFQRDSVLCKQSMMIAESFPNLMFSDQISIDGYLSSGSTQGESPSRSANQPVLSTPSMTHMQVSKHSSVPYISSCISQMEKITKKVTLNASSPAYGSLSKEEMSEHIETLHQLQDDFEG